MKRQRQAVRPRYSQEMAVVAKRVRLAGGFTMRAPYRWTAVIGFSVASFFGGLLAGQDPRPKSTDRFQLFPPAPPRPEDSAEFDRPQVETELFGLLAEGSRFVYVLDRSASMGEIQGRPMQALRRELRRSLAPLSPVQEFQIVFYNHRPDVIRGDGGRATMIWATDENKERAARFMDQIHAAGGTDHLAALRIGLALRPDILFFLTDADRPQLSRRDLETVSRLNGGTRIFAIELGQGAAPAGPSFLKDLAQQSGGRFRYLDILDWEDAPAKK